MLVVIVMVFTKDVEAQSPDQTPFGTIIPGPCPIEIQQELQTTGAVECGLLEVPENHQDPTGPLIRLSVIVLRSRYATATADPLFIAQGGPGGSTIDIYAQLLLPDSVYNQERDIVLWDQRGTLYTDPSLACPEYLELTLQTLNKKLSDEESNALDLEAAKKCRDRLNTEGVNLSDYDSLQNAADVEALRKALGYEKINFYGVSYGSLLGLHLSREYPHSLRSLILDAVVPTQTNFLLGAGQSMYNAFNLLFTACENDDQCKTNFPELETVFYETIENLNQEPAEIQVLDIETGQIYPALLDGELFLNTIFQLMYSGDQLPFIPKVIYDSANGNYSYLANTILPILIFDRSFSEGMYYSTICAEDSDYTAEDINTAGLPSFQADYENRNLTQFLKVCDVWDVQPLPETVDDPVTSQIPTLLLSGIYDPITPPEYAEIVAQNLTNSYSIVFPAGAHGQAFLSNCADQIILEFLQNPLAEPTQTCIQEQVEFVTNQDFIPFPFLKSLLGQDLPAFFRDALFIFLLFLVMLTLGSASFVYPIARLIKRRRKDSVPDEFPYMQEQTTILEPPAEISRITRSLPSLAGIVLFVLILSLTILTTRMIIDNELIIFFGYPISTWPIFILPFIYLLIVVFMMGATLQQWIKKQSSTLGRIYYSGLVLVALFGLFVLYTLGFFVIV
jgi:pimeloyl-ACP methyl ester carboxylesterase